MALRVLLADESSTIKKVFEIGLKDFGLEIRNVQHGIDVIEVAEDFQPDIIFADVLLSKMNGYEVCAQVKDNEELKTIPVVLMWSSFMDIDNDKYTACNADGRLEKPFSAEQLRDKIQSLVPRTLDNKLAAHLEFDKDLGNESMAHASTISSSAIKRGKNPSEDLLFKEDLPLESHASPEALDQDDFDDVDLEPYDHSFPADESTASASDEADEQAFDGFQALDISGAQERATFENDKFSDFQINTNDNLHEDEDLPLDFQPPSPNIDDEDPDDDLVDSFKSTQNYTDPEDLDHNSFDNESLNSEPFNENIDAKLEHSSADAGNYDLEDSEITAIPSLEEEADLLEKSQTDSELRTQQDFDPHSQGSAMPNIQHRNIDELSDEDFSQGSTTYEDPNLPPVPQTSNQMAQSRSPQMQKASEALQALSKDELRSLIQEDAKEILQSVIWEVVPELAQQMIEKEVKRLLAEEEKSEPFS